MSALRLWPSRTAGLFSLFTVVLPVPCRYHEPFIKSFIESWWPGRETQKASGQEQQTWPFWQEAFLASSWLWKKTCGTLFNISKATPVNRVNLQYSALSPQTKYPALPEVVATARTRKEARSSFWKLVYWLCQRKLKTKANLVRWIPTVGDKAVKLGSNFPTLLGGMKGTGPGNQEWFRILVVTAYLSELTKVTSCGTPFPGPTLLGGEKCVCEASSRAPGPWWMFRWMKDGCTHVRASACFSPYFF